MLENLKEEICLANQQFFQGSTGLLIHADNLMEEELPAFLDAHLDRNPSCLLTMLTFQTDRPSRPTRQVFTVPW